MARLVLVAAGGLGAESNTGFLEPMLAGPGHEATEIMLRDLFHDPTFVTCSMINAAWEALAAAVSAVTRDDSQSNILTDRLGELAQPVLLV